MGLTDMTGDLRHLEHLHLHVFDSLDDGTQLQQTLQRVSSTLKVLHLYDEVPDLP